MKTCRKVRINELVEFDESLSESNIIIGTDEAGRGPVAGPVTACAVYFPEFTPELCETLKYLDDSKKFSSNPKLRKELAEEIKKHAIYKIAECSVAEIEKYNILQASLLAMKNCCDQVIKEITTTKEPLVLVDGKIKIPKYSIKQLTVIKGDSKSASIAAASVIAKVHRDEFMLKIGEDYPDYCWKKNKGYPTKAHLIAIKKHGCCEWHRKSFLSKVFQGKLFEND